MLELPSNTSSISIGELATLITAAGVGIYVLGLIGVALSIRLTFTNSWSTAWYAASLMPRVVVAGQGTRVWRSGMIEVVLLFASAVVFGVLTLLVTVGLILLMGLLLYENPWRDILTPWRVILREIGRGLGSGSAFFCSLVRSFYRSRSECTLPCVGHDCD
jgi:hypothetical protein